MTEVEGIGKGRSCRGKEGVDEVKEGVKEGVVERSRIYGEKEEDWEADVAVDVDANPNFELHQNQDLKDITQVSRIYPSKKWTNEKWVKY